MINHSKRSFLSAAIAAAAVPALTACGGAGAAGLLSVLEVSQSAAALVAKLGITYPIFSACMGGWGNDAALAAAVSDAGGLGGVGATWMSSANITSHIDAIKARTAKPFAIGYLLQATADEPATLATALAAGAPVIQFSFGIPTPLAVTMIRSAGAKFGCQVGSPEGVALAVAAGADYVILQGMEAGGHVQAQSRWHDTLADALVAAGSVPLIVGGGLSTGQDLLAAMRLGASGGLFGTRFVASEEAPAAQAWKDGIVAAGSKDQSLTICFADGWPNTFQGVLRNNTLKNWEAAGSKSAGFRPGEGDTVYNATLRYSAVPPGNGATGTPLDGACYAGTGVPSITDLPPAGQLVARIWSEVSV